MVLRKVVRLHEVAHELTAVIYKFEPNLGILLLVGRDDDPAEHASVKEAPPNRYDFDRII